MKLQPSPPHIGELSRFLFHVPPYWAEILLKKSTRGRVLIGGESCSGVTWLDEEACLRLPGMMTLVQSVPECRGSRSLKGQCHEIFDVSFFSQQCLQHQQVETPRCLRHCWVKTPRCLQHRWVKTQRCRKHRGAQISTFKKHFWTKAPRCRKHRRVVLKGK